MNSILRLDSSKQKLGYYQFPYRTRLSFVPLINHWKKKIISKDAGESTIARIVTKRLDQALEFLAPIEDPDYLEKHRDFVELMLVGIFPSANRDQQLAIVSKPFDPTGFYYTPQLQRIMTREKMSFYINREEEVVRKNTVIRACCMILNQFYGQQIKFQNPVIFTIKTGEEENERHYKSELNIRYVEIKKTKALKALNQEEINYLLANSDDIDLWLKHLPPTHFEFHGLVSINLVDVSEEESLSRLKRDLLDKDAVVAPESIARLQVHLRQYFNLKDLRLGLSAIDNPVDHPVPHKYKIKHSFLSKKIKKLFKSKYQGSIYEKACKSRETVIVEDLEKLAASTGLEKNLRKVGFRSVIIIPLLRRNKVIGLMELGSTQPFAFNSFSMIKLIEIVPLFRTVMRRSRQEIDNEIEAIIREGYTSLHPSVEWKFIESAFHILERRKEGAAKQYVEPIVFNDVFPLYGQADIVQSTNIRNQAIQADLLDNLQLILDVLNFAEDQIVFPLAGKYQLNVQDGIRRLKTGINSEDEFRIMDFIKKEIHPLLEQIRVKYPILEESISQYFSYLDPEMKTVYRQRKAYEASVTIINNTIASFLEKEEKRTQKMLPHYFEKFKTDGVSYDIYMGQSLLRQGFFNQVQLNNMRLWQLIAMCKITQQLELIKPKLPLELDTAQLILVHNNPLSIRFRLDEKKFDVDGSHNIRYVILKKRIDKAMVEGTLERLTQAGKLAIVYTSEDERIAYGNFLKYLLQKDLISPEIEYLNLEKMQGVQGLRAIRVKVICLSQDGLA